MVKDKTWYILKDPIPASRIDDLLGSVVEDFRDPTAGFIPASIQPRQLVSNITTAIETNDLDARLEVNKIRATELSSQLLEIFTGSHSRAQGASVTLDSARVHTRRLIHHAKLFADLIAQPSVKTELETLIRTGKKRKFFFVVGIKTCSQGRLRSSQGQSRENTLGAGISLDALAGVPGLISGTNLGSSIGLTSGSATSKSATWDDERIFAIEYRVARRDWFGFGAQTSLGAKLDKGGGAVFFNNEEDSDLESESDAGGDEVEELGLVDSRFAWPCFSEDGAQLDETSGYIFSVAS